MLVALTAAFVTFGGALTLSPLFAEGDAEQRFRRAREVFLLFSGMFSTVVGFYFASATTGQEGLVVTSYSFDARKAELKVSVAGGKAPFEIMVEYGEATPPKKKMEKLDTVGSATFNFERASEWPRPLSIKVKDAASGISQHKMTPDRKELLEAGFVEPKEGKEEEKK